MVVLAAALIAYGIVSFAVTSAEEAHTQEALQPFYDPPAQLPNQLGAVIRSEPMSVDLANGTALRVLYTSTTADGMPRAVSGMVFLPTNPTGASPVVAWAHPTLGQAPQCAPSRSKTPLQDTHTWLDLMLARGWVVAATDYAGLGTPGDKTYLLGDQSARDIVGSVRAARALSPGPTSEEWLLWSHSQGGQAALWAASQGPLLAPELRLLGVGAAAPAAELVSIIDQQWDSLVAWVIGPQATQSFVPAYPDLDVMGALEPAAQKALLSLDEKCDTGQGIEGLLRQRSGQKFFASNPMDTAAWSTIAAQQTPPMPPAGVPMFLAQGTADEVVLANTNALLQTSWCAAGVDMQTLWLGGVDHDKVAAVAGPAMVEWAADRFARAPTQPNCAFPPPVAPATPPSQTSVQPSGG